MALEIPSFRVLLLQAQQDLDVEADGALRSTLSNALAYAIASTSYAQHLRLRFLSKQFFIDTANAAFALLWASIYGVEPNVAVQAAGPVTTNGTDGNGPSGGEVLERGDGVQYTVDAPGATIVAGQAEIAVTAVDGGTAGNADPGTDLTFLAPPAGVNADAVVTGIFGDPGLTGGLEAETADAIKERTLAEIRAPNIAGAEADYVNWALSVDGVATAFARDAYAGVGTVLVIITQQWDPTLPIVPGNTPIPGLPLIAAVEAFIDTVRPAGLHLVAVQIPVIQELTPFILLDPDTPEIQSSVTTSLQLTLDKAEPGSILRYDDLVIAIDRAAGEEHHQLWTNDGFGAFGPNNTTVGDLSKMVPGTITWTAPP